MDKLTTNKIQIEDSVTLDKIKKIVNENFDEKGRLKKQYRDIVIIDYPNKIK